MTKVAEKGTLFYFDEIKILLYACGYRQSEGILLPEKEYTEEEIVGVLYHLTEMGVITACEKGFRMKENFQQMFHIVGSPESTYIWRPVDSAGSIQTAPEFFCYMKDGKVVVSERYWKRKETIKFTMFSLENYEEWRVQVQNDYSRD